MTQRSEVAIVQILGFTCLKFRHDPLAARAISTGSCMAAANLRMLSMVVLGVLYENHHAEIKTAR